MMYCLWIFWLTCECTKCMMIIQQSHTRVTSVEEVRGMGFGGEQGPQLCNVYNVFLLIMKRLHETKIAKS